MAFLNAAMVRERGGETREKTASRPHSLFLNLLSIHFSILTLDPRPLHPPPRRLRRVDRDDRGAGPHAIALHRAGGVPVGRQECEKRENGEWLGVRAFSHQNLHAPHGPAPDLSLSLHSSQISTALATFGLSADTRHVLVARFLDGSEGEEDGTAAVVAAVGPATAVAIDDLASLADGVAQAKAYGVGPGEVGPLADAVATRIACREVA